MWALRLQGKASSSSNLTMHPKLPKLSDVLGTRMPDSFPESARVWLRFFSSIDRETFRTGSGCNRDDDDDLSSTDGNGPQPIPGRLLRGDGQAPRFNQHHSVSRGRDFEVRGRDAGGQMGKRPDLTVTDKFDSGVDVKKGVGFSGETMKEKNSRPSINDLFNKSSESQPQNGHEQSSFLEKFKLSGIGKIEGEEVGDVTSRPPEEEEEPPQDADMIFKKMKESGLIPNAVAMLDGLCKDGLVNEAMKLFGLMREKGTMPEVVIYTAVVDGFCKAHKFDDAKRIFRKMQSNGITPNAFSYAVLIKGLYKCRKLEDAVDFSVEMLEAGHSLSVATFTELIDVFCKEKGVEEARSVINALEQKGFYMDEKTVRDHLNKKGPRSLMVWEAVFGQKKTVQRRS